MRQTFPLACLTARIPIKTNYDKIWIKASTYSRVVSPSLLVNAALDKIKIVHPETRFLLIRSDFREIVLNYESEHLHLHDVKYLLCVRFKF